MTTINVKSILMGNVHYINLLAAVHINFVLVHNDFYLTTSAFTLKINCNKNEIHMTEQLHTELIRVQKKKKQMQLFLMYKVLLFDTLKDFQVHVAVGIQKEFS